MTLYQCCCRFVWLYLDGGGTWYFIFPFNSKIEVKNKHWNQKNGDNGQCEIFHKRLNRDSKSGYTWWRNGTKPEGDFNLEHEHSVGGATVRKSPPIFFFPFLFFFEISSELVAETEGISLQMNMQNYKQLSKLKRSKLNQPYSWISKIQVESSSTDAWIGFTCFHRSKESERFKIGRGHRWIRESERFKIGRGHRWIRESERFRIGRGHRWNIHGEGLWLFSPYHLHPDQKIKTLLYHMF